MSKVPIVPGRGVVSKEANQLRLNFLKEQNIRIDKITDSSIELPLIRNNIESYIGTTEIPVGIVGPILYNDLESELVYCPAATLEGALLSSMNRGAKAISQSGGFSAEISWQKMTRAPMFLFASEQEAITFIEYVNSNFNNIKREAEKHSNHAQLIEIIVIPQHTNVHLKFVYTTADASGQNMTTTCTWHAMLFLVDNFKKQSNITPIDFVIEGNGASDKKISQANIDHGRGIKVKATCTLSEDVINKTLRTSSENLLRCFTPSKELALSNGMIGYNINTANAIAAIYCATGQDLACIHESATGYLNLEKSSDGLTIELELPNLVIGTVGGGTHLPKQSEALEIMGCLGTQKVERFAKLIAGFTLGLEISTYSAVVNGEFAKSHEKLGRNKPTDWLIRSELNREFILSGLNNRIDIKKIEKIQLKNEVIFESGILSSLASINV